MQATINNNAKLVQVKFASQILTSSFYKHLRFYSRMVLIPISKIISEEVRATWRLLSIRISSLHNSMLSNKLILIIFLRQSSSSLSGRSTFTLTASSSRIEMVHLVAPSPSRGALAFPFSAIKALQCPLGAFISIRYYKK